MQEKLSLIQWVKDHKRELIIAGVSAGTIIAIILTCRNWKSIVAIGENLRALIKEPKLKTAPNISNLVVDVKPRATNSVVTALVSDVERQTIEVNSHIRNLPVGWHASNEKLALAAERNIELLEGQTWVASYKKGIAL